MKEFNKPEEEIVVQEKPTEKTKRERPYFDSDLTELEYMVETYRKILRVEPSIELKSLLKTRIEELERELRFRNKISIKPKS